MNTQRERFLGAGVLGVALLLFATGIEARTNTQTRIVVVRADQVLVYFDVDVAVTGEQRRRGLMWREYLAPGSGMLFDFGYARLISMWMKDTLIPLDMLFVDAAGNIVDIKDSVTPRSTQTIRGALPARYVLEINGGEAALRGIASGDRLRAMTPAAG
jgi:uncharacterized membrane protein (UPF0127 family)